MIKINLSLDPAALQLLREMMELSPLSSRSADRWEVPDSEPEFQALWTGELLKAREEDCGLLLKLMRDERFGQGEIEMEEATAEAALRACSDLRLHFREKGLQRIPDSQLEAGQIEVDKLSESERRVYFAYILLAGLQHFLVNSLDPECADFFEGMNPEDFDGNSF